jgi:hypothetical protein
MTKPLNIPNDNDSLARGIGRKYYRDGLSLKLTLAAADKAYPELARNQIALGWSRERHGR